ncbi:hypothetical protein KKF64_02605 [Patescibacteria group bacterium]|nr:hypothetical protein [Patescibacteria group bacterium]
MHLLKNKKFLSVALVAFLAVFGVIFPAHAQSTMGWTATILSSLAMIIIELLGKLLIVLIEILLAIVKYNDFINADAVTRGWILVRDVSNMAFLIIFIAIAFATILGVEKYEWKRLLPKLLIMSVAINFSKTICGIIIDGSQVVMMTFVNGFKDIAAGNLIRGFGLSDMLSIRELGVDENITDNAVAAASILAVVLLLIAAITLGVIVLMFLVRIIYLWILIILSPLAFMLAAAPGTEAQFQKWFQKFIKYAFIGPIMAFFLWLSFSVMAGVQPGSNLAQDSNIPFTDQPTGFMEPAGNTAAAISGISRSDNLLSYFIAISLLLLSLVVANSIGVAGGNFAGSALAKIKSGGVKLGKFGALGLATGGAGAGLGLLGGKYGGKGIKKVYKGAEKMGLTGLAGHVLDTKFGSKITRLGGKVLSKVGPTKEARAIGEAYAEKGGRIADVKKTYLKYKERKEKEEFAIPNAVLEDQLNKEVRGRNTNRVFETTVALAIERKKEMPEDEDGQVRLFQKAQEEMKAGKKGAEIDWLAAYMALKDNNGDNTLLTTTEVANPVVKESLRRMGDLGAEGVVKHKIKDDKGNDFEYTEIEEEYQKSLFLEQNPNGDWDSNKNSLMLKSAQDFAAKTADEKKKMQDKIATRLYAQEYNLYEFDGNGKALGYAEQIVDSSTGEITAHAGRLDENGEMKDAGKYVGSADAFHEQTLQMLDGDRLKQANPNLSGEVILQLGRELDGISLKNKSFGLAMKNEIKEDGLHRINLATKSGKKKHAGLVGGKMRNLSVGETSASHPLVTSIMSASQEKGKEPGTFYNATVPEYAKAYSRAAASGDTRGYANTRIDHLFALADSAHIADQDMPYTPVQQYEVIKKFNNRNHFEYGRNKMPENQYHILFLKLLNNLGVKGIANNTQTNQPGNKYDKLTKQTVSKAVIDS